MRDLKSRLPLSVDYFLQPKIESAILSVQQATQIQRIIIKTRSNRKNDVNISPPSLRMCKCLSLELNNELRD